MNATTLALLLALLSGREMPDEAPALERAVRIEGPLRGYDERGTVAVMLATADEESGFRMDVHGDSGRAKCAMQLWSREDVSTPEACMLVALRNMKESQRMDAGAPLAQYCGGRDRPAARRMSARRIRKAAELVRQVGE